MRAMKFLCSRLARRDYEFLEFSLFCRAGFCLPMMLANLFFADFLKVVILARDNPLFPSRHPGRAFVYPRE